MAKEAPMKKELNNVEKRMVNLEIRNIGTDNRKLVGYAAVFKNEYTEVRDRYGDTFYERVLQGAFKKSLIEREVFMLINHDWNKVVGRTTSNLVIQEDKNGLRFELNVPNTTDGNDLLENVKQGIIKGCSFGFNVVSQNVELDDDGILYRDIHEVELFEITATHTPVYKDTEINARSQYSVKDIRSAKNKRNAIKNKRNAMLMNSFYKAFVKR